MAINLDHCFLDKPRKHIRSHARDVVTRKQYSNSMTTNSRPRSMRILSEHHDRVRDTIGRPLCIPSASLVHNLDHSLPNWTAYALRKNCSSTSLIRSHNYTYNLTRKASAGRLRQNGEHLPFYQTTTWKLSFESPASARSRQNLPAQVGDVLVAKRRTSGAEPKTKRTKRETRKWSSRPGEQEEDGEEVKWRRRRERAMV